MEKFGDILNNIKERFTNPLIFSFICSWLVINWQITVGLLWFDAIQIEHSGYTSIFEFIRNKINTNDSLWHPLIFAFFYTGIMPVIKNVIQAFYSWTSKWGEKWNLNILNGGQISIDKYLKLKADFEKRTKDLEEVISSEKTYFDKYEGIKTELLEEKKQMNLTAEKLIVSDTYIRQLFDLNIMNGSWESSYDLGSRQTNIELVYIENSKYYVVDKLGKRVYKFDIKDFHYDNRNKMVFFVKEVPSEQKNTKIKTEHYNINRLRFDNKDLLTGFENGTTTIVYKRK